jgi:hypothetical protein
MKRLVLGSLLILALAMAAVAVGDQRGDNLPPRAVPAPVAASGTELIVVPTSLGDKNQMLTVVDPRQRVVAVYHIESTTGKITLKSVRNIQWDLQIDCFNSEGLTPEEIRSAKQQK